MKRSIITGLLSLSILFALNLRADEGMWIPMLIDDKIYDEMQALGLELTPEQIYSVNQSSLKDAVVIFGRGCTGEIISDQGLLLTNHHCGYGQIQSHSSVEHDYLKDGFWAMSKEEELPNPGLTARFLVRMEYVTERALNGVTNDMTEDDRSAKVRENTNKIIKDATDDTHYDAVVRSFYEGNEYYLFIYETYRDVRLVGAPPSSIGKFGADTDNWMWPRHTGDFSLFRVYSAPDGTPADYSEDNIPLKPKHYLPISLSGVEKGDFAMILGYPGGTQRYMTSWGVDNAINNFNPTVVEVRDRKLEIMREAMDASDEIRIKYATKYARTSNYWKYFIGQTKGLKRLKVFDKKRTQELSFTNWVKGSSYRKEKYGDVLDMFEEAYETIGKYTVSRVYISEAIIRGAEILSLARNFDRLYDMLSADEPDQDQIDRMIASMKERVDEYFKNYDKGIDKNLLAAMMEMYSENVPANQQPEYLKDLTKKYKGDFSRYAEKVFDKSIFATKESVLEFLENPKAKKIAKDPAYEAYKAFMDNYKSLSKNTEEAYDKLSKASRLYVAGLMEMHPEKDFYPDANFTMRLTYGTVQDYKAADAVYYNYYTTLHGVMEKEDPSNWEFIVPDKLKLLYEEKDYGKYGDNGTMKVCFLTTHDITGGNSGSPVINSQGALIGLAFDGNWEAMSGDIAYEPDLQRTINVDIRYVLFIIDKFAGAQNIIDELTLVKTEHKVRHDIKKFKIKRDEFMMEER